MAANNQDFQRSESDRLNEVKGHLEIALLEKHFLREYAENRHLSYPFYYCFIICVIPLEVPSKLCYCDVIAAVLKDTHGSVTSRSLFISCFPKKGEVSALYSRVDLWPNSDSAHSTHRLTSILLGDTSCPILCRVLIVCNRLWSLPLSPTVSKKVGACECEREYLRLFPFTLPLPEMQRRDSPSHGVVDRLAVLAAVFHSPASFTSFFFCLSLLAIIPIIYQFSWQCLLYFFWNTQFVCLVPSVVVVFNLFFLLDKSCAAGHKKLDITAYKMCCSQLLTRLLCGFRKQLLLHCCLIILCLVLNHHLLQYTLLTVLLFVDPECGFLK